MLHNMQVGFPAIATCHFPISLSVDRFLILLFSLYKGIGCILSVFNLLSDTNGRIPHCEKQKLIITQTWLNPNLHLLCAYTGALDTDGEKHTLHTLFSLPKTPGPLTVLAKHTIFLCPRTFSTPKVTILAFLPSPSIPQIFFTLR